MTVPNVASSFMYKRETHAEYYVTSFEEIYLMLVLSLLVLLIEREREAPDKYSERNLVVSNKN